MNTWYLQRLKTMGLPELAYRVGQWKQAKSLKKEMGARAVIDKDCTIVEKILPAIDFPVWATQLIDVFGIAVHPVDIHDWHYDVLNKTRFPNKYAKEINIRTAEYGSAKHVWEINRMLFLPRLALMYRSTGEIHYVTLIMRLIESWVVQNPYLTGINWYSNIEVNIRLINWFLTWEIMEAEKVADAHPFVRKFLQDTWLPAIYQHCKFSHAHPSLHSSANNHLISEYAGLFIASSKWKFKESEAWNSYAKEGLEKEIIAQHTKNGINREEAAEYIQFITDFLLLSLVVGDYTDNAFSPAFKKMFRSIIEYIKSFLTIAGQFPKYGDEDDGRVFLLNQDIHDNNFLALLQAGAIYYDEPDLLPHRIISYQKNLVLLGNKATAVPGPGSNRKTLENTKFYPTEGHFIFRKQSSPNKEIYCHFDAAPLGYLSIAAHGHADALSFEMHLDGQPFLVDPGTYCYHTDADWRRYFVSTRAHNTVGIMGVDQANFIGPTLWLNHYNTHVKKYGCNDNYDFAVAGHSGYKKYKLDHVRKMEFFKQVDKFIITDYITSKQENNYYIEMPFHIHPAIKVEHDGNKAELSYGSRKLMMKLDPQMQWTLVKGQDDPVLGWYSNRFYSKEPSAVIIGCMPCSALVELKTELHII